MQQWFFYSANNAGGVGNINNENSATDSKNLRVKVWKTLSSMDHLYVCGWFKSYVVMLIFVICFVDIKLN